MGYELSSSGSTRGSDHQPRGACTAGSVTPVVLVGVPLRETVAVGEVVGTAAVGQLALKPLEISLRRVVFKVTSNLGLLCLSPAAAHWDPLAQ